MEKETLFEILTPNMLPSPLNSYAHAIGIEALYKLTELVGGGKIYLPKPDNFFRSVVRVQIKEDYYKGELTLEKLAQRYGLSTKTVWRYINDR